MKIAITIVVMIIMWAVARKKGFNPFLWILGAGIPGLIALICMPSASSQGISEAVRQRRRKVGDLVGLILTCVGVAAISAIVLILRYSSPVSPWDLIHTIPGLAASLVMLIAVFRLYPETRSSWRTACRWFYTAHFALSLMAISYLVRSDVILLLQALLWMGAAVSLLVLATLVAGRMDQKTGANQPSEGPR